jgi:transaldolase
VFYPHTSYAASLSLTCAAWGRNPAELYSCALDLSELEPRVVIKLPFTLDGLKAARRLRSDEVPFTLTAVYSSHQAATAVACGASYVAPYLGRMTDAGKDVRIALSFILVDFASSVFSHSFPCNPRLQCCDEREGLLAASISHPLFSLLNSIAHLLQAISEVLQMQTILETSTNYEGECRLLVASIRSVEEVAELAAEGCNTFTVSPAVADQMVSERLSMEAAAVFQADAEEMGGMGRE